MKPRRIHSYEDAVTRIMGALTAERCGEVIGKSESLIRKAADPDTDFQLSIAQAEALDRAYIEATGDEPPILTAMRERLSGTAGPGHNAADPLQRLASVTAEVGEVARLVEHALADDGPGGEVLTPRETYELGRAVQEAIDVLQNLVRDVNAKAET